MNLFSIVVAKELSHCETSPLKDEAPSKMSYKLVALEVSHVEMSSLKLVEAKRLAKLVALEVSHVEMCPYLASVVDALLSHSSTAAESVESSNEDARLGPLIRSTSKTRSRQHEKGVA